MIRDFGLIGKKREFKLKRFSNEDKKSIEDAIIFHFHKFGRFPSQLKNNIPNKLYEKINVRWEVVVIQEQERKDNALNLYFLK